VIDHQDVAVLLRLLLGGDSEAGPEGVGQISDGEGEGKGMMVFQTPGQGARLIPKAARGFANPDGRIRADSKLGSSAAQHVGNGRLGHSDAAGNVFHLY
jgi:hypothetical protein